MPYLELLRENPVLLAPMAGVADAPFRALCKKFGAGLTCTEMISARGLLADRKRCRSWALLRLAEEEKPAVVQLFGADPDVLAESARRVAESLGPDLVAIDVNMACPVPKVIRRGEGGALMGNPALASRIIRAISEVLAGTGVWVSAKIRAALRSGERTARDFALRLEDAGAAAVALHGRSVDQLYQGRADWQVIAEVKAALHVPVIGSGDVHTASDACALLDRTAADGCMVARGALGYPWIFSEARALLSGKDLPQAPSKHARLALLREHAYAVVRWYGDDSLIRMRKHAGLYVSGLAAAGQFRRRLHEIHTLQELDALLEEYEA